MVNNNISNELKIYELSLIWKEAEYNFAFWNKLENSVNWDEEYKKALPRVIATNNLHDYYMELKKFLAILRDGHTDVQFPSSVTNSWCYLPILCVYIDGKHVIFNVHESVKDEIKRYSVINKINGIDIDKYIEDNIFPYIWHEKYDSCYWQLFTLLSKGEENSEFELEISDEESTKSVKLKRGKNIPPYNISITPSEKIENLFHSDTHSIYKTTDDIGIITLPNFFNNKLPDEFFVNRNILEKMRGFIIDMRYNSGGNSAYGMEVLKTFVNGEFDEIIAETPLNIASTRAAASKLYNGSYPGIKEYLEENTSREEMDKLVKIYNHTYYEKEGGGKIIFEGSPFLLTQPMIVLSSQFTGSAAETLLMYIDITKRANIIGTASCGSTGDQVIIKLESGGWFRICTRNTMYPDGRSIADVGIQPNIKCDLSLNDYKNGVDSVLNKGLEEIRKLL